MVKNNQLYPVSHIARLRMGSDGEGIRTLILFQECTLRCKYCINPFTWNGTEKPKMMTPEEIYQSILIDRPYLLATNGGVTFGGGEPLLHSAAVNRFAEINEDQFTIYVETALNVPRMNLKQTVGSVDRYYVDIKTTDSDLYKKYTGGELRNVLENLEYLIEETGTDRIVVRIPIIPGFTAEKEQVRSKEYLETLGVTMFDLFSYKKVNVSN